MNRFISLVAMSLFLGVTLVYAGADIKLKDVPTDSDTSIVIKKGATQTECVEYEIIDGKDEITGDPSYDKGSALKSWKEACKEWKGSMREMNKTNQMITLNCNRATSDKEGDMTTYKSLGAYKMKVKVTEKK